MIAQVKLKEVSLYALPAIRYAIVPSLLNDFERAERIFEYVSKRYDVTIHQLQSPSRLKELAFARQVAIYAMRKKTNFSLKTIGQYFSRDHTTAIHSISAINDYLATDKAKQDEVEVVLKECLL